MNGIDQHYIKYLALVIQYGGVDLIECENVMLLAMKKYEKISVPYAVTILPLCTIIQVIVRLWIVL